MLPLFRVLPVASLLLSALIFVLAEMPPRRASLPNALAPARGPLIDAAEHPEWRQFYVQAAFKRADEIEHLRELPDTPTRMPPVAADPEPQKPAVQPVPDSVAVIAPATPQPEKHNETADSPVRQEIAPPPATPLAESPRSPPPALEADTAEPPLPVAPPQQIAGLPNEHEITELDDITAAVDSPVVTATIPAEIGETSSTELPVVLPPQRPAHLRSPPRPKASSRAKTQHKVVRQSRSKRAAAPAPKQQTQQPSLFHSQFGDGGAH
jgi:hypothetical protein